MFSVLIAAHNAERFIGETINSLRFQTLASWECLMIVNGSVDGTLKMAHEAASTDERFRVIEMPFANKSAALNEGLLQSRNDWISILDADDFWHHEKLRSQEQFILANPEIDVLGTQLTYVDERSERKNRAPYLPTLHDDIAKKLNGRENVIANSSAVYRKSLHKRLGYYDTEVFVEDYDWWLRCLRGGAKFANLGSTDLYHRLHASSNFNTSKKQHVMKSVVDQLHALKSGEFSR